MRKFGLTVSWTRIKPIHHEINHSEKFLQLGEHIVEPSLSDWLQWILDRVFKAVIQAPVNVVWICDSDETCNCSNSSMAMVLEIWVLNIDKLRTWIFSNCTAASALITSFLIRRQRKEKSLNLDAKLYVWIWTILAFGALLTFPLCQHRVLRRASWPGLVNFWSKMILFIVRANLC